MFHRDEPNYGRVQNCAVIASGRDFLLGDGFCNEAKAYMCEKDQS